MPVACLIPKEIENFKKALKERDLNVEDLLHMDSEARTELLKKYAGDNAKIVNTLFEEKLVLKNRILGIKNLFSKLGEIGKYSPEGKLSLEQATAQYKALQRERIFSPKEHEAFLNDLADKQLGTHVTQEQAKHVFDLTNAVDDLKQNFDPKTETWTTEQAGKDYGASKVVLDKYMAELKGDNTTIKQKLLDRVQEFQNTFKENKAKAIGRVFADAIKTISNNSIALVASVDNSFLGRQGLKVLLTHPSAWLPGALKSFSDFAKTIGGQETHDALMADVYSRPNYMNGNYDAAKIFVEHEEQFPTSLPEKVPYAGRVFKASEQAFAGSALRMRTDLFDLFTNKMKENGVDITKDHVKDIGNLTNSLTARGKFGKIGESPAVKLVMWSPRMLKANLDVLTGHGFGYGLETDFAKAEAYKNMAKVIGTTAAVLLVAKALKPNSVEGDPRSSDFGKIKVGNTRFDITGGAGSLVVLAARVAAGVAELAGSDVGAVKSPTTGVIRKFGTKTGDASILSTVLDFLQNKTTPTAGLLLHLAAGKDQTGAPVTLKSALYNNGVPISIQNFINLKDDPSADAILGAMVDLVGFNANTFHESEKDWNVNPSKELIQLKDTIGDKEFAKANDLYNNKVSDGLKKLKKDGGYQVLSDTDKQAQVDKMKAQAKKDVFKQYNFKYKAPPKKK